MKMNEHTRVVLALITVLSLCLTLLLGFFGDQNYAQIYNIALAFTIILLCVLAFSFSNKDRI